MTIFESIVGDITKIPAGAIVNAANRSLAGGGGVDGAIHRAAGPELRELAVTLGPCEPGEAHITPGYRLPADWVIHTVGPIWEGGKNGEPELLANCYKNSLRLAAEARAFHVVFPGISTGAYGYPLEAATRIAVTEIASFIKSNPSVLERVTLIWLDQAEADLAAHMITGEPA